MSGLYAYTAVMMQKTLNNEYENYSKSIESFLTDSLLPLVAANDKAAINEVLSSLSRLDVIESIKIYTFDDIVFELDKKRVQSYKNQSPGDINQVYPLELDFTVSGESIGRLEANLFLKERAARSKETLRTLLLASAIATFLFITIILHFLLSIKNKLGRFELAARAIANDEIPEPIPTEGTDEFSNMALAFNSMLFQLREKYVALDMSPDGILIVNDQLEVTYINSAFSDLLSVNVSEVIGVLMGDIDDILRSKLNFTESEVLSLKHDFEDATLVLNDKQKTTLRCHKKNHITANSEAFSNVYYFSDITHEKKVEQLKSEFLNTAAHELRTPLAVILGYSELLINFDYDSNQGKESLSVIHSQSLLLTSIIDDLLDIAKIEATSAHYIDKQCVNLSEILDKSCDEVTTIARRKDIYICRLYPSEIEANVDPAKLRRAIVNILSNAIKYSSDNTTIEVFYCQPEGDDKSHKIAIRDQGIGMTEEQLNRLGEKFYRVDESGSTQGTGLGVSISQQIIKLHGGKLIYKSAIGEGTTAYFTLPKLS